MSPRPILHLNSERGWRGGERQTLLIAQGLAARGWAGTVGCSAGSPLAEHCVAVGLPVLDVSMRGALALGAIQAIRRWLTVNPNAIVYAHTAHAHTAAALALLGRSEPLIVARRVAFPLSRSFFTRWKFSRATRVIAVSSAAKETVIAAGVDPGRIPVVFDGIDLATACGDGLRLRPELGLAPETPLVVCVANLSDDKDHATLLRVWTRLAKTAPDAHLVVVGAGEREADLRAQAAAIPGGRVHFLGFRSDVPDLLAAADVVVLTSRYEGLGSILMDAQANAKPIVATRAGGVPEIVAHETTGLLAEVGDDEVLAGHLQRLLADPRLARRLGAAGVERAAKEFGAEALVAAHERIFLDLP